MGHFATGVAVIPHVVRAGVVVDARFGLGIYILRQPDGTWGNPVFVRLEGVGIGGYAGVESRDMVLVFQTATGLERDLRRCLAAWEANRGIDDFELGEHDKPDRLLIAEKLNGRERDIETLLACHKSFRNVK